MKHLNFLLATSFAIASVGTVYARASDKPDIERLGRLVQSNSSGNARFYGDSAFVKTGKRSYITKFAKMLAKVPDDVAKYEVVLKMAIWQWENKTEVKAYTSDLAGAMAFYTVTNIGVAHNENSKDYLIPNLVDQYKKCLSTKMVAGMSNSRKEDLYDFMVTESMYMEVLIASEPEMRMPEVLDQVKSLSVMNCQDIFGVSSETLAVTESGLIFQ
ncbi:MAG: DUF6683 family protein [Armatimonadota bacterium]